MLPVQVSIEVLADVVVTQAPIGISLISVSPGLFPMTGSGSVLSRYTPITLPLRTPTLELNVIDSDSKPLFLRLSTSNTQYQ